MQAVIKSPKSVSPQVRQAVVEAALPEVALSRALNRPLGQRKLTRLFRVMPGWEAQLIAEAEGVLPVYSEQDLRAALKSSRHPSILVQLEAKLDYAQIENLLYDEAYTHTILLVSAE